MGRRWRVLAVTAARGGPAIVLTPNFALTVDEVLTRAVGGPAISISASSFLLLDGDITIESLTLDGALSIRACAGASVVVRACAVVNQGLRFEPVAPGTPAKAVSIRGYAVGERADGVELEVTYSVEANVQTDCLKHGADKIISDSCLGCAEGWWRDRQGHTINSLMPIEVRIL